MFVLYSMALAHFMLWFCFSYVGIYDFSNFFHLIVLNFFSCHHIQINYILLNFFCSDTYYGCAIHLLMEGSGKVFFPFTDMVAASKTLYKSLCTHLGLD